MTNLQTSPPRPSLAERETVMGTVVTFELFGELEANRSHVALSRARAVLRRADATFSTYKPASPISLIRRGELDEADAPVIVRQVLASCAELRELTDGWFDPWKMPGGVDPSGYVKGWAAAEALAALAPTADGVVVNAAGDVATAGHPRDADPFRIGVVAPVDRHRLAFVVTSRGAVATSATYERGEHLFDPHDGCFRSRVASATVCGPDLAVADALATALAVAGPPGLAMLQRFPGYDAALVGHDGRLESTAQFPFAS